ncbi:MAG: VWA domain-containing protein [Bacteroidetes bacterium]|nr:VWA domain-containing protein [Bacteroidota bacterium]
MKFFIKNILLIISLIGINFSSSGQIKFSNYSHDFGTLSNWSQTPAIFEYQNVGTQPEAFLNAIRSSNVHIKYATSFIQPGEKGQVLIYFEPLTLGPFSTKIKLYVGSSTKAFEFTISGKVTSYLECPSVNMPADPAMLYHDHKGIVIDSKTKEAIPNAQVKFISSDGEKFSAKANKEGRFKKKLKLGMYQIIISAEAYNNLDELLYLNKNSAELVFELDPIGTQKEIAETTIEKEIEPLHTEEIDEIQLPEEKNTVEEKDKIRIEFENEEIETEAVPIEIIGIVLNEMDLTPIDKASVILKSKQDQTPYYYKTYKDGKFYKKLAAGVYYVTVNAPNFFPLIDTIVIEPNQDIISLKLMPESLQQTVIETELKPAKLFVAGTILNEENREPVKRASITLTHEDQAKYTYLTMKDGKYQKTLIAGTYFISILAEGYIPFNDTVQIEYPTHDLDFLMEKIFVEEKPIALIEEEKPIEAILENNEPIEEAKGVVLSPTHYAANNIVFLVDVSSSMKKRNKLDNLKTAMKRLTEVLRDIDQLSLISYASKPTTIFTELPADEKDTIFKSIDSLAAMGLTHGVKGLERAYIIAELNYIEDGNNQVIVATDGVFNSPDHSEIELIALITKYRQKGIITSVIGFGNDDKAIRRMKRMASLGNGNFIHILDEEQARTVLIEEIRKNSRRG